MRDKIVIGEEVRLAALYNANGHQGSMSEGSVIY